MSKINLVIFDLDDTLIRSSIKYTAIKQQLYNLFPSSYSRSNFTGIPILHLLKELEKQNKDAYQVGLELVENSEKLSVESATVMKGAKNIPEILQKKGIKGFIYTNNSQETINLYLDKSEFQFLKKFPILTRNSTENPKPDPEGILKIIKSTRIPKKNTIYIGDSYIDAEAASRAGIRFFLYNSRDIDLSMLPETPAAIINQWLELENLLLETEVK